MTTPPPNPGHQGQPDGQPQYGQPQYGQPQYGQQGGPSRGTTDPNDLTLPLYGATFPQAITRWLLNYVNFSGRASRSEFWWVALLNVGVSVVLQFLIDLGTTTTGASAYGAYSTTQTTGPLAGLGYTLLALYALVTFLPSLGLVWRRLHDTDRSGGFYFLALIPIVGGIIVIVLLALDSRPGGVRFDRPARGGVR
jgi:uncharacterized membrane protein YhaH (DUF805 family)